MTSFLETAAGIAREAGALTTKYFDRGVRFDIKGEQDLVTEADHASEALILERLRSHFPTHTIIAEESGLHDKTSEYRWYVDPVDGTTNFAHGYPVYNVTLALEHNGEMIAGVVYDPTRDEMFMAERGSGAYLNHRRMQVSPAPKVEVALFSTGFPTRRRHADVNIHFFYQLAMVTHGIRRSGSAAIDLAHVACGRLDGFWEFRLSPWDMAAGRLLVEEAGGQVTDMKGRPHRLEAMHILASNGKIHADTLRMFEDVFAGRFAYALPEVTTVPDA
ncbi:MAG: inositol monophosphatase [Bryobacteraceae bacterium]|nr:inositol monophosphatase [Bryobacteraceae bacterium]